MGKPNSVVPGRARHLRDRTSATPIGVVGNLDVFNYFGIPGSRSAIAARAPE